VAQTLLSVPLNLTHEQHRQECLCHLIFFNFQFSIFNSKDHGCFTQRNETTKRLYVFVSTGESDVVCRYTLC